MTPFSLDRPRAAAAADRYLAHNPPLFSRLPVSYRAVPLGLRTRLLAVAARARRHEGTWPSWPIVQSIDHGLEAPMYAGHRAAFILTHDIDSAEELGLVDLALELDRRHGIASSYGFVPEQSWPMERLVRDLVADGREVYWHDIRHDGRLPYVGRARIRAAFDAVRLRSPWTVELMRTFRAGQLLASRDLISVVGEIFAVDMSIPDTERDGPFGAAAGCGTVFPFRLGPVLEVPVTMPQDVFLRQVYRWSPDAIEELWLQKLSYIARVGGVANLNVHPIWIAHDRELRGVVDRLLEWVTADSAFLVTTPSRLAVELGRSVAAA
ncbi:MAG TPA: hypothetical protein VFS32_06465 [Candidatus Limnocylindrales bacterium]|nr:hypothetical protein [Candidatus Limnocylindrales bacterium]